jgi:hypothetical protein
MPIAIVRNPQQELSDRDVGLRPKCWLLLLGDDFQNLRIQSFRLIGHVVVPGGVIRI